MIKKYLAYLLIVLAVGFAFYRGKRQAHLDCIDFNVLPIVANSITIIVCAILIILALVILKKRANDF